MACCVEASRQQRAASFNDVSVEECLLKHSLRPIKSKLNPQVVLVGHVLRDPHI